MAQARTEKVDTTLTSSELAALDVAAEKHDQSRAGMLRLLMLVGLPSSTNHSGTELADVRREIELAKAVLGVSPAA